MAIICTNRLLGNDTTGNGSSGNPYSTINKALSVAIDNDEIRVAGSEFTQLAGTVSVTVRGTTMTTSTNLTGSLVAGDTIAIDTSSIDGWDKEKTLFLIASITSTTITLVSGNNIPFPTGTYNIWKLNQYHYAQTTTMETISAFTATSLLVSGGWDATFTTQIGWTAARNTTSISSNGAGVFMSWAFIKPNIIFDKFLLVNTAFSNNSSSSYAIHNISFLQTNATFPTSNFGVYNGTDGFTTIIANNTNMVTSWNGSANKPTTCNLKQWITCGQTGRDVIKIGYGLSTGAATGPSIRSQEVHWRTGGSANNASAYYPFNFSSFNSGDLFIDSLNLYLCGNSITTLCRNVAKNANSWNWIGDINVIRTDVTNCGINTVLNAFNSSSPEIILPININRTSGLIDELPWISYGNSESSAIFGQTGATIFFGKDSEGQKVVNTDAIVKYADPNEYVTGSNSIREKLITNTAGADNYLYIAGTTLKPTTAFTLTIKAKASKTVIVDSFRLLYGSANAQQLTLTGSNLTTTWQDFTFNIDPTLYADWNLGSSGLMSVFLRIGSGQTTISSNDYIYIDSVTVS